MSRAHKIGSLLFCPDCGTLLNLPVGDEQTVVCEQCAHEEPASSYENIEITTRSHPDAFPSALQQKRKTQTKTHNADEVRLRVSENAIKFYQTRFFLCIIGDRAVPELWAPRGVFRREAAPECG